MVLSFILSFSSVKRSMKRSTPMALAIATRYPYCKTLATPSLAHVQLIDSFPQLTVKHGYLEQSIYYFKITICWHHPFLVLLLLGPVLYHDLCLFHVRLHRCYNDHLHGLLLLLLCVNDQAMFEQRMTQTNKQTNKHALLLFFLFQRLTFHHRVPVRHHRHHHHHHMELVVHPPPQLLERPLLATRTAAIVNI